MTVEPISKATKKHCDQENPPLSSVILIPIISDIQAPSRKLFSATGHCGLVEGGTYFMQIVLSCLSLSTRTSSMQYPGQLLVCSSSFVKTITIRYFFTHLSFFKLNSIFRSGGMVQYSQFPTFNT